MAQSSKLMAQSKKQSLRQAQAPWTKSVDCCLLTVDYKKKRINVILTNIDAFYKKPDKVCCLLSVVCCLYQSTIDFKFGEMIKVASVEA